MHQTKLANRTALGVLAFVPYIATGVLAGAIITGCTNPVKETYGKGVEGRERAIEKARGVQDQLDDSTRQMQEQGDKMETSQ